MNYPFNPKPPFSFKYAAVYFFHIKGFHCPLVLLEHRKTCVGLHSHSDNNTFLNTRRAFVLYRFAFCVNVTSWSESMVMAFWSNPIKAVLYRESDGVTTRSITLSAFPFPVHPECILTLTARAGVSQHKCHTLCHRDERQRICSRSGLFCLFKI